MEAPSVDLPRRDRADADLRGAADDGAKQNLPPRGAHLLRIVEQRERADAVVAQAFVVEQHPGDDERPRERTAAGLVRSGYEAGAEAPVKR
jgi:hypothetical protein